MYLVYSGWFDSIRKKYFKKILSLPNVSSGTHLLDYGCGPGDLLLMAKEMGFQTEGVDSFPRSVDIASERGLNVTLGDAASLSFPPNTFDVIILQSVIEHIDRPLDVLNILLPMLRPGGSLVISAPTPCSSFWDDPTHIRPYTPTSLKTLGELLDVEVVCVSYVFAFLLGINISNSAIYKLMNVIPIPLGSNLIAIYRKP